MQVPVTGLSRTSNSGNNDSLCKKAIAVKMQQQTGQDITGNSQKNYSILCYRLQQNGFPGHASNLNRYRFPIKIK